MNWRLLASNHQGQQWTTLDVKSNQTFAASEQTLGWNLANTNAYNLYRLQIDSVSNPPAANSMQLDEIEFIGVPAYTYFWNFGDGATSSLPNPQYTYATNGNYLVTLTASDGAACVTNTMAVSVFPLRLAAAPAGLGLLTLSWPAWADNCHLYSTTNLVPPLSWSLVTNAVTTNGSACTVALPAAAGARFFQLRSP